MAAAFVPGFLTGLSLILAIGAQNAFVLRQGLTRRHVFAVCAFCAASDAVLIAAGVAGAGSLIARAPALLAVMRYGGAAFLIWYGARAIRSALKGGQSLAAAEAAAPSLRATLATAAALTWLNPHVYLDTVMLLGAVSTRYAGRLAFALGAMSASAVFFFSLGYGARLLAPLFARPRAWQVLDALVGAVMWAIAASLLARG